MGPRRVHGLEGAEGGDAGGPDGVGEGVHGVPGVPGPLRHRDRGPVPDGLPDREGVEVCRVGRVIGRGWLEVGERLGLVVVAWSGVCGGWCWGWGGVGYW